MIYAFDDASTYHSAIRQVEMLRQKIEPNDIKPIVIKRMYNSDYGDGWATDISLVREFGKDSKVIDDEIAAKVIADGKPVCIAKDGLNVLDDCGNVSGYIDMLLSIHEGDWEEATEKWEWARKDVLAGT